MSFKHVHVSVKIRHVVEKTSVRIRHVVEKTSVRIRHVVEKTNNILCTNTSGFCVSDKY